MRFVSFAAKIGLLASFIASSASAGSAQDIGYLDLTTPAPRMPTSSVMRSSAESCGSIGGPVTSPGATITLINLDKTTYSLGEEITFELKIENSGKETIEIPWTPDLALLGAPSDRTPYFSYHSAAFVITLKVPDSDHFLFISGFSYGSTDLPGTIRELRPGQSFIVRVRGTSDVYDSWWSDKLKDSAPLTGKAFAGLVLSRATETQAERVGVCIPLTTKAANQLNVILWPASR